MREALEDPALLGNILKGDSWRAWRTLLIASRGEPLTQEERRIYRQFTKRARAPTRPVDELWLIAGRRGGKSRAEAVLATYYGGLCDYKDVLAPGEQAVVLCIAPDTEQANIIFRYTEANLEQSPILRKSVKNSTNGCLELTGNVSIEVRASSFRRLRGPTYACVLCDEAAFYYSDDSANPDTEILRAVRPGLLTTGGPLIVASSPYARRGELHATYDKHFGTQGDKAILVAQGSTYKFNPKANKAAVEKEYNKDPVAADAEYGANFRRDIEAFLSKEAVEACISKGVREIAPAEGIRYHAFVDPSGGSMDSMTLAIGHRFENQCIIDCIREARPPFSPESVTKEFAHVLKSYRIFKVAGDHFGGLWPREQFAKRMVEYNPHVKPKSELYLSLLAAINSETVELLDNERLKSQLVGLERRTSRAGRDSIDHGPNQHDDIANAVAGITHEVLASHTERLPMSIHPPILITGTVARDEFGYRNLSYRR